MKIYKGNNLLNEIKELTKENFNNLLNENFSEYENEHGYNVGDYVLYKGCLYKCCKSVVETEEFNEDNWKKVLYLNTIKSLSCKDNKLYIGFENGDIKQIESFSLSKAINEQVDYCQLGFNDTITQISTTETLIPFTTCNGNMSLNDDGTITLKANKTYKLSFYFRITDTDTLKALTIKQNGTFLFNAVAKASEDTETCTSIYIFTPTKNTNIGIYTPTHDNQIPTLTSTAFYTNTKLIIEEIAQPVVNNINCSVGDISNNDKNLEDTPIGHVISFMGTSAPEHYLICDGTEYNITDYRELADFINTQFGSYNYFGGDGTTTFAVPDLRNEFIRGYHGDSTDTLSGDIGKHQDATTIPKFMVNSTGNNFYVQSSPTDRDFLFPTNIDKNIIEKNATKLQYINTSLTTTDANNTAYTTRPTNVAVLFCIKYEHTYYANITNTNTYKETILYKNSIPIVSTLDKLDATKYATTDTPMELTFDEDLSQYDRLEIVLGTVTYSGNNYWIPINDKVQGKTNENIYYRNCLMVTNNSYCSVQLDYIYTDKKIILRNYGMSTSDMKGATVLKVIGIKY